MEDKMSILQELQAQRADVVGKLKRIDEKKSTVSVEVYEKVKKEYADKLKGIEEELSGHVETWKRLSFVIRSGNTTRIHLRR
jgi:hypothetical protein